MNTKQSNRMQSYKDSLSILKVMNSLKEMTIEEVSSARELKVTYIGNKKAKIVKWVCPSEASTGSED